MNSTVTASNRGSALLIVLGLLSFLMISAVAFSISMRTERTAAAAYRRGLMARELLDNAFVDARATVEHALRAQQENFNVRDASTRTVKNLAPFRYPNSDTQYGRLMASYDPAESDAIAYLLDDAVMRHVPPYVAYAVYTYLEKGQTVVEGDGVDSGNSMYSFKLDTSAGWKPILVDIPDTEENISGEDTSKATVGRMAWAVINLSDSLDLNAVGSASSYRGIGLTANDFAFGTAATGSNAPSEIFDLIETSTSPSGSEVSDLPVFCSNADIARYAAKVSGSTALVVDNGNEFPYAWQDAVDNEGDGFYSPFSCYSFWPNAERDGEGASDRRSGASSSSSSAATDTDVISCDDVKQSAIQDTGSELASILQERAGGANYLGNDDAGQNFVRLLLDYIDNDSAPAHYQTDTQRDLFANAQPTVENVPMLAEVGYDTSAWRDESVKEEFQKAVEEALDDVSLNAFSPVKQLDKIAKNLNGTELEVKIPEVDLNLALRAYFPGYAETTESFDITPVGFMGVVAAGKAEGGGNIDAEKPTQTTELKAGGTSFTADSGSDVFTDTGAQPSVVVKPDGAITVKFKGDNIPVTYEVPSELTGQSATPPAKQKVTLAFLVDYLFRVETTAGNDVVDRCPTDKGLGPEFGKSHYATTLNNRFSEATMKRLDAQYFRVTCPVSVTFALQWKLKVNVNSQDNSKTEIEYDKLEVIDDKIEVAIDFNSDFELGSLTFKGGDENAPSYQTLSPERGTWFTVDPRYNWLSPMLGLSSGSASAYGVQQSIRKNLSSPHWLFVNDEQITTGADPSDVQQDYAAHNEQYVPFSWGLNVEDIRYGHNDSGQLLLPGEVGFLPVPMPTSKWHPNEYAYNANTIDSYYNQVAKVSFFRTVPMVDLKDGALSDADYEDYARLCKLFGGFAGENFPEEHRGLVNVFAAQDNYYVAQQLRQFAMLGIPASIKQAAKVTFDRLKAAESAKKVSPDMVADLEQTLGRVNLSSLETPKYDEFVTDYLFPLPKGGKRARRDWNGDQELYKGGGNGRPARPQTVDFIVQDNGNGDSFADRLAAYNDTKGAGEKLGQNDMTTLLSVAKECFGDRQQIFLYILRADAIAYNSGRDLSKFRPLSTARAVALVWRDAYGELPDRVIYYQVLP